MTGRGGWPMTVFMMPDGRPFYGGTYYPREPRFGMPSFRQVLEAVSDAFQNQGIGSKLIEAAINSAAENGYKSLIIGTGNTSFGQLYLYQKMGFKMSHIIPNFFTENYTEKIEENGLTCTDMVVLKRELRD